MHRFWESIINPVLSLTKPEIIVEIGSDSGHNTKNLLGFAQQHTAKVHVIDPLPKYNIADWKNQYGEYLIFHQDLSLNALPKIDNIDLVLIDGDHNWYTVINELRLIEKNNRKNNRIFPIILLHDINWPYGRRDLYYNPDTIPAGYRKPFERKGIIPGQAALSNDGGLNTHLNNSIYENDIQNGVLTAVEDFLEESKEKLDFVKIPALFGIGILFSIIYKDQNPDFSNWINKINSLDPVLPIIKTIELIRIQTEIESNNLKINSQKLKANEATLKQECEQQLKTSVQSLHAALRAKETTEAELQQEREQLLGLRQQNKQHEERLEKINSQLLSTQRDLQDQKHIIAKREGELHHATQTSHQLSRWIEQLQRHTEATLASWRWKVGNSLVRLVEILLLRPKVPLSVDHMKTIFQSFLAQKKK